MNRHKQPIIITALFLLQTVNLFAADQAASSGVSNFSISVHGMLAIVAAVLLLGIFSLGSTIKSILANNPELYNEKASASNTAKALLILIGLGLSQTSFAAAEIPSYPSLLKDPIFILLAVTDLILLFIFLQLFATAKKLIKALNPGITVESTELSAAQIAALEAKKAQELDEEANTEFFGIKLTDHAAIENEKDILLDHEYDGIKELDNNLPPWWVYMFYATILFGVVYIAWYHVLPYGQSQHEEYIAQMEEGERQKEAYLAIAGNRIDESNVTYIDDAKSLAAGKEIYVANCVACHAKDLGGGVGPNLVDEYWIHGGSINDVFKVIKYGVPTKGMIPWQANLTPVEMQQVSSYILSMQGTEPANPKEPQGEKYKAEESQPEEVADL
jgi:cytochrome c oxidase cbb3-type subunit 3